MTKLELKNTLIGKINDTKDENILIEVYKLLNTDFEDQEIYQLSKSHVIAINTAIEQIKNGEFIYNVQADKEIDEWLNK